MRVLPSNYLSSANAKIRDILVQIKLKDAENTVLTMDKLYPIDIKRTITDGSFGVGFASSDRIAFAAATTEKIAKNTRITLYNSFGGDYERLGRFYCETSPRNGNVIEVTAFDAMNVIRERTVKFTGIASKDIPALTFPCKMQEVLDYVVAKNGLTCDFQCEDFVVQEKPMKSDTEYYTDPEILGFIASAHARNAKFDYEGKLVFVGFSQVDVEFSADNVIDITIDDSEPFEVTGILFTVGDDTIYIDDVAGSEYDEEAPGVIKIVNPLATVEIAEYVWHKLGGLKYYGGSLTIRGTGLLECGDVITVKNLKTPDDQTEYPLCITSISYSIDSNGFVEKIISDVSKSKGKSLSSSSTASSGGGTSYLAGDGLALNENVFSLVKAGRSNLGGIRISPYASVPDDDTTDDRDCGIYVRGNDAFPSVRRATKKQIGGLYLGDGLAPTVEQSGETYTNTGHVEVRIGEALEFIENDETTEDVKEKRQNNLGGRAVAVTRATREKFGSVKLGKRIGVDAEGAIYSVMSGKDGIEVSDNGEISVLVDEETITVNGEGKLVSMGGGVAIENAVVIREADSKLLIHEYTEVEYIAGNKIGYAGPSNQIILQGFITNFGNNSTAAVSGTRYTGGKVNVISGSTTAEKEITFEIYSATPDSTTYRVLVNGSIAGSFTTFNPELMCFVIQWESVNGTKSAAAPYGYATVSFYALTQNNTGTISASAINGLSRVNVPFISEAEYNAAIGLTYEPNMLTEVQETVTEV
jgi:hypothetical protein